MSMEFKPLNDSVFEARDANKMFKAAVKWDGCVDYRQWSNGDESDLDYIHICSIDEMVKRLLEIKAEAIRKFGETWDA